MPTVLDELLVETRVSLAGLQSGIRSAEQMAAQASGRIQNELAPTTFLVNTSEATASIRSLSEATTQLHASLTLLRAQLAQPFRVSVDTSELRRAARDVADLQAAMASVGAPAGVRAAAATGASVSPAAASGGGAIVVRGSGSSTSIIVSGPVMVAGTSGSFGGGMSPPPRSPALPFFAPSSGAIIPPSGSSIAILPPSAGGFGGGAGPAINMARNAAGVWSMAGAASGGTPPPWQFTGFGGGSTGAFGQQFVNPGLQWGQQFVPPGQAARFTPLTPLSPATAGGGDFGFLGRLGTGLGFAAAFGTVFKIVSDIRDVWNEVIEGGTQFNALMEVGTINIAALLSQTREFRSASGQTVDVLTNYKLQLGAAAGIQKELVRLDAETLGTVQDLQHVFAQVLAHGRGQVGTDTQRLQLATGILNASVLMGNTQQQHTIEARQTLTGQSHVGNVILMNLGISNKMIQSWREQGVLIEKLLERLELFNRLGRDAGQTWEGLTNSMTSLTGLMAGMTGKDLFEGQRHALLGQTTEMRRQQDTGAVFPVPLAASTAEMETYGQNMARVWLSVNQAIVGLQNSFLTLQVRGVNAAFAVADAWTKAKERMSAWTPDWLERGANFLLNPGAAMMGDWTSAGIPIDKAGLDAESLKLAERRHIQLNTDTSQMSSQKFQEFLAQLAATRDETQKLQAAADQLHGTNQLTEFDYKRITANLKLVHDEMDKGISQFEKGILPSKTTEDDGKAARERERLMDRRESATRGADSAELALQQRIATITGDTAALQLAAEQKIENARKEGIREAQGDVQIIAAVNRKAANDQANLEIDATQRIVANRRREDQAAEESAQRQLRAAQIVGRAKVQLAETELTSIRRRMQIADDRGADPAAMNALFNEERAAIERARLARADVIRIEFDAATREVGIREAKIADLDRMIAQTKTLGDLQTTWSMRQAGDVNAPFVSATTGRTAIGVGGAQSEILLDRQRQLTGELVTQRGRAQEAGEAMARANERAEDETRRNIEAQRLLNRTIGERVVDRLREDAARSADTMADIGVRGVYRISDALSDMANKGKFSFKSLVQAANEMANDITRELMREAFRNLILGRPMSQSGQGGAESGIGLLGAMMFGGGGTRASVMTGGAPRSYMPPADAAQVQWQLATTGIQQIAQTGTMATQALTQASSGSFSLLSSLATAIISSIQAMAAGSGGGGGGFMSMFSSLFSGLGSSGGGASFGNVISGGSSTAAAVAMHQGGVVPHFASGGFAGNEVPAILHKGEMVLSAAETHNLMRYGSARLPGGMGGGGARTHGGGHNTIVHMTVNTPDVNSFMRNKNQISSQMARQMNYSSRRNN